MNSKLKLRTFITLLKVSNKIISDDQEKLETSAKYSSTAFKVDDRIFPEFQASIQADYVGPVYLQVSCSKRFRN